MAAMIVSLVSFPATFPQESTSLDEQLDAYTPPSNAIPFHAHK